MTTTRAATLKNCSRILCRMIQLNNWATVFYWSAEILFFSFLSQAIYLFTDPFHIRTRVQQPSSPRYWQTFGGGRSVLFLYSLYPLIYRRLCSAWLRIFANWHFPVYWWVNSFRFSCTALSCFAAVSFYLCIFPFFVYLYVSVVFIVYIIFERKNLKFGGLARDIQSWRQIWSNFYRKTS